MKQAIIGVVSSVLTLIFVILSQKGCELEKMKHEPLFSEPVSTEVIYETLY